MASVTFRCSSCKQMLRTSGDKAGKKVKCKCGAIVTVPSGGEEAEQIKPASAVLPPARKPAPPLAPVDDVADVVADVDYEAGLPPRRRPRPDDMEYDEPRRGRRFVPDEESEDDRAPRRRRPAEDYDDDDDYDRPRHRRDGADAGGRRPGPGPAGPTGMVTLIGVLNLLFAGIVIVCCIGIMIAGPTLLAMTTGMVENIVDNVPHNDPQGKKVVKEVLGGMRDMGTLVFLLTGSCAAILFGVPLVLAGIGVLKRRQWGRVLTLILAALAVLAAAAFVYDNWRFLYGAWPLSRYAWIWVSVNFAYGLVSFIILLIPRFGAEFQ